MNTNAVAEVVHEGEHLPTIDLGNYKVKTEKGKMLGPVDIAKEAMSLDVKIHEFTSHIFGLAGLCKSADEFGGLTSAVEEVMHWGRPRKTDPLLRSAPRTWTVYKSVIFNAWKKEGVYPGLEYKEQVKDKESGEFKDVNRKVESFTALRTMAQQQRANREAKKTSGTTPTTVSGVIVTAKGEQIPIPERIPLDLGKVMARLATIYGVLENKDKHDLFKALQGLVEEYEGKAALAQTAAVAHASADLMPEEQHQSA